eukprot:CAMPEP_0118649342 /NCGR_PEP_ID=MMETSP0785-20121206/9653_1 /TAXON_ID=91992 /ORGANISM="Bolidomonas pacifica, Strain CCMP 1866" /LENGTH=165 /DNA_ID=CAMNT_0006541625 /DNA_START=62 /DNA_END=555 /DNA_ORIENTATION=-
MTRFNGTKRVKVAEDASSVASEGVASGPDAMLSFNGSVFGSMGQIAPPTAEEKAKLEKKEAKEKDKATREKEKERKDRERKKMEGKLLKGETEVAKLAKHYRESKIPKHSFVDPAFEYMGETLIVWSSKDFVENKETKDELRKKARRMGTVGKRKKKKKKKVDEG